VGIAVALVATRRVALRPLETSGLARMFLVFPAVRKAIAELAGPGPRALSA